STAHTILYYDRFGAGVFRALAARERDDGANAVLGHEVKSATARFDLAEIAGALEREQEIWRVLVREQRHVSRAAYLALARALPSLPPRPTRYRFVAGEPPSES